MAAEQDQGIGTRLRRWLGSGDQTGVKPYTISRIAQSLDGIPRRLAAAPRIESGLVFDVGCGSAFDSFALADAVGRTYAIDVDARAIGEGTLVARRAGIPEVTLVRTDVTESRPPSAPSLVWCNIMSHNVPSRVAMLAHIASVTPAGASLLYAEASEGYPLLELERAVRSRDAAAARARLRQAVAGAGGVRAFRFFASGTAAPLLDRLGFELTTVTVETAWRGIPVTERLWAQRREAPGVETSGWDDDYLERVPWLARLRDGQPSTAGLERVYATMGEVAVALRVPYSGRASLARRIADHASGPLSPTPDWHRLDALVASWSDALPTDDERPTGSP